MIKFFENPWVQVAIFGFNAVMLVAVAIGDGVRGQTHLMTFVAFAGVFSAFVAGAAFGRTVGAPKRRADQSKGA